MLFKELHGQRLFENSAIIQCAHCIKSDQQLHIITKFLLKTFTCYSFHNFKKNMRKSLFVLVVVFSSILLKSKMKNIMNKSSCKPAKLCDKRRRHLLTSIRQTQIMKTDELKFLFIALLLHFI